MESNSVGQDSKVILFCLSFTKCCAAAQIASGRLSSHLDGSSCPEASEAQANAC